MAKKGKVYLVGAGPGDPGLLTLRAKELLTQADVVVYDALVHPQILKWIPDKALKIFRGHRTQARSLSQSQINRLLIRLAQSGKSTVRLKGGDPFVFGRGAEEILALKKEKIPFEVVPGVSSAIAVPAYAGIPVTHRELNSSFTVVTGHESPEKSLTQLNWKNLAENTGTLIFLMGLHTLKTVCEKLIAEGKNKKIPAAVIQHGSLSSQRTVVGTLETIFQLVQKAKLSPPAILVVGDVVRLRSKLDGLHHKPLWGLRILVTRTREQSSYLTQLMSEEGAEVIEIPTIEIHSLPMDQKTKEKVRHILTYHWIILTSSNAVNILMDRLKELQINPEDIQDVPIACLGESTAQTLSSYGLKAALVPRDYKQEGLVKVFQKVYLKDKKILFPRAQDGRNLLMKYLKKRKARVDTWALYENKIPQGTRERLVRLFKEEGGVDLLVFASSSSVNHFYGLLTMMQRRQWARRIPVAAIGPVTAASVRKWGGQVVVQPHQYTMPDLVKGLIRWVKHHKRLKY